MACGGEWGRNLVEGTVMTVTPQHHSESAPETTRDAAQRTAPDVGRRRAPHDLRTASRWFAAILMPIGPLTVAILRYVLPYNTTDSPQAATAKIAAQPGSEQLVLWLTVLAVLTLVPGALAAIRLASRRAPIWAAVAAVILVPAYLCIWGVALVDEVGITAAHGPVSVATVGEVAALVNDLPTTTLLSMLFVVGHVGGSILLAVALRRSRQVGRIGCWILGVSQPLHFAAAVSGNHPLDLFGWLLTAVGMALAARALIALPNDQWDLPPAAQPPAARRPAARPPAAEPGPGHPDS
jgi:hypothetical protein